MHAVHVALVADFRDRLGGRGRAWRDEAMTSLTDAERRFVEALEADKAPGRGTLVETVEMMFGAIDQTFGPDHPDWPHPSQPLPADVTPLRRKG